MSGVTWSERRDGDWLASNGRWYPATAYPRSWDMSALPPAPEHAGKRGIFADRSEAPVDGAAGRPTMSASPPSSRSSNSASGPSSPTGSARSGMSTPPSNTSANVVPPSRAPGVATATVTSQRTHTSKLPSGPKPRAGLPPAPGPAPKKTPPPPGRYSDDAGKPKPPPQPSPPATSGNRVAPKMPGVGATGATGDLGQVFGAARKRIEKALDELE